MSGKPKFELKGTSATDSGKRDLKSKDTSLKHSERGSRLVNMGGGRPRERNMDP